MKRNSNIYFASGKEIKRWGGKDNTKRIKMHHVPTDHKKCNHYVTQTRSKNNGGK